MSKKEMNLRWKIAQAAEIRWWQRYLNKKPKADYLNWKKAYWTSLLEKLQITIKPEDSIMDAGCGPAGIFIAFPENKVEALDPLLDQYEANLTHFKREEYASTNFVSLPLEQYEVNEQFDLVFCLNAINHVADLELSVQKVLDATKPGGELIVSIDAHNYPIFKKIFRLLPGDILHPHQYDLAEYTAMFESVDCKLVQSVLYKKEFFFDYHILHFKKA